MLIPFMPALMLAAYLATPNEQVWDFKFFSDHKSIVGKVLTVGQSDITIVPTEVKKGPTAYRFHVTVHRVNA